MTKILLSPHRIDTDLFRPAQKVPGMVLFVGRLSPEKRVSSLIEAVRSLPWAHLHLVGDGPERGPLGALTLSLRVAVTWHCFLPQREVAALMAQAPYFVLASRYEQASKVLLEAMASGCMVIATPEASRGVLTDGQNGYLCDGSPGGIRRALEQARTDHSKTTGGING